MKKRFLKYMGATVHTSALQHYLCEWRVPGTPSTSMCTYEQPAHEQYLIPDKGGDRVPRGTQ